MKALVLAAGDGTRMRPLTSYTPKPLLLVAGKPFLLHSLLAIKEGGIEDVTIIVGWQQEKIRAALGNGKSLGMKITYIEQTQRLGTAHAVGMAKRAMGEDFLCLNGDVIYSAKTVKGILDVFKSKKCPAMALSKVPNPKDFGIVVLDDRGMVQQILEKPKRPPTDLVNAGLYAFRKDIFDHIAATQISPRGEYEITDTLMLAAKKDGLAGFVMDEPWMDVGRPFELLNANERLMEDVKTDIRGTVEDGVVIQGPLVVEEGARIRTGAYIVGPVIIGANSNIGPHCFLRGKTTIGRNCHIGAFVEVKNSIVMDNSNVPHHNYVGDSIIGSGCNLGSGTKVANLRLDNADVPSYVKGKKVETGRRKLGVIMGDNVKTGINAVLNVGTVIGEDTFIGPGAKASGYIAPRSRIY